ncbi:class GN sortase [Marinobacter salarius]|jgi:sortase A|uniref:class GN sortase n=1 Tax=Marinobacter salarius TaxID=1420917 RepID=UPI0022B18AA8|nr:class GN sortase [Marinobacter salarius]MCZ4283984.1 class GN sortase [Marinobacter salarius]|tara:strand:- start:4641 stop:5252 length:612 start_codon:yes stop_codon:yes gene_type:complete
MNRLILLLATTFATVLAVGLWIPFKALVAQELLELAWAESQARQQETRPWPWADTWPVARLMVPETGQSLIVLDGAHGESLAFGPGQVVGNDGRAGPVVIAGHRDTHFRGLQHLETGSRVKLQDRDGDWRSFRVDRIRIVDSRHEQINTAQLPRDSLLLVTCYPFDGLENNGPLRYVVEATAEPLVTANKADNALAREAVAGT